MRKDGLRHHADHRPKMQLCDERYYKAYRSLSSCRLRIDGEPQSIQVSEIAAEIGLLGLEDPATKQKYKRLIQGLDAVELKSIRARLKAAAGKK